MFIFQCPPRLLIRTLSALDPPSFRYETKRGQIFVLWRLECLDDETTIKTTRVIRLFLVRFCSGTTEYTSADVRLGRQIYLGTTMSMSVCGRRKYIGNLSHGAVGA